MSSEIQTISKGRLWAGRIIGGLPALFLLADAIMKLVKPVPVIEATVRLGYPESVIIGLGIVLLASTILYLIPQNFSARRYCVDRISGRCSGDTCAGSGGMVFDYVRSHFRSAALGWTVAA